MIRDKCKKCDRPVSVCLCPWISEIANEINLIILRHKSEATHPLNTAKILELSLKKVQILDGEIFKPFENATLIYPMDNAVALESANVDKSSTFIILDGTWRKTRKILYMNSWLNSLPAISLPAVKSSYILRKKSPEGFSTVEAAAAFLGHAESNSEKYSPMLNVLNKMMQFQIDRMGEKTFNSHFGDRKI